VCGGGGRRERETETKRERERERNRERKREREKERKREKGAMGCKRKETSHRRFKMPEINVDVFVSVMHILYRYEAEIRKSPLCIHCI